MRRSVVPISIDALRVEDGLDLVEKGGIHGKSSLFIDEKWI
jgi:hypothetical protein